MSTSSPTRPPRMRIPQTKKIAVSAVLVALAMIFSYIEAVLPSVGIPGVKLGLANLLIIIALYRLGPGYAFAINIVRIILSSLMFSGIFAMIYSLVGGLLSLTVMCILKRTGLFSTIGISMAAGVAHNFGQVLVAALVIENAQMFVYFPLLVFSGIVSGIIIGLLAHLLLARLPRKLFE